jgi:hypothetical protein
MSDAPAPVEDAHFVPLSQSQFTWQPGRLVAGRSDVEGNAQADLVSRLVAQHVRYKTFMPRRRSRSPRAKQARGCAQPVESPVANPVTTSLPGRAACVQPGLQIPNVPVFSDSAVLGPQGQFDPALRMPVVALETPPRHVHSSMAAQPSKPTLEGADAARQGQHPRVAVDPNSSEKTTAATSWVTNVARSWNL